MPSHFQTETVKLPKNFNLVSRAFSLSPFPFLLSKKALGTRLTLPKTRPEGLLLLRGVRFMDSLRKTRRKRRHQTVGVCFRKMSILQRVDCIHTFLPMVKIIIVWDDVGFQLILSGIFIFTPLVGFSLVRIKSWLLHLAEIEKQNTKKTYTR